MNARRPATHAAGQRRPAPATSRVAQRHSAAAARSAGQARSTAAASSAAQPHPTAAGGHDASRRPRRLARVLLLPIRFYQRVISPALPRRCKYHPTCSDYAVQAISSYGILRGGALAGWRLLRCNPWSHGGYDPVSAQTLFRRPRSPQPPASDS